jgi:alkanesulfonate monooxygenase SsuD/methylene tetrahydromethanopterin reductase-like flavin-dependent oxidoreductase (luciferase family)
MEFGIFNSGCLLPGYRPGDPLREHHRLIDEVEWTKAADRSGFKYSWATEHHFLTEYSHLSANEVFMGYLCAATSNIHVGSGIINITPPVNPPARVAERVAMLDHLSEGRFEFGMGRGSSSTEQKGFGIEDPELTREMFDEVIAQFRSMWRDDEYGPYSGRFFSMPQRNVLPKPYTKPHPPMWVAAGSPSTFEKAAKMGLGVLCFTTATLDSLKPLIEKYKTAIEDAEPVGDYVNNNIMVTSQMLCLEDGQRVRDIALTLQSSYHHSLLYRYLDTFPRPAGIPVWPDLIPEANAEQIDLMIKSRTQCFGTPDEVADVCQEYADAGVDQLVFGQLSTTMSREVAIETVETFGRHVLPQFDKDPVHSTIKQREAQLSGTPA